MHGIFSPKPDRMYRYYLFSRDSEIRAFKLKAHSEDVVQVVISHSTIRRRGRTSNIGIYFITLSSLRTNYGFLNCMCLTEISKNDFDRHFFDVTRKIHGH